MKKWIVIIVVLLVIFGAFWAWSHYSTGRSMAIGTGLHPSPAQTAPQN